MHGDDIQGATILKPVLFLLGGLVCLILLYGLLDWIVFGPAKARAAKRHVLDADHVKLVVAGRQVIAAHKGGSQVEVSPNLPITYWQKDGLPDDLPEDIKALNPLYITVDANKLYLRLNGTPRVAVSIFAEGVTGSGSEQVVDGLWLCY